jgi:thiamine pyrophosphate-dependent acetolactate synthase large subunit-like protein
VTLVLEALGASLPAFGMPVMFGLPGSGNYELIHAARAAGVHYVGANHEAGAVGMADGWARVAGRTGLVMLSQGPGVTNGLTALTEAVKSRTALVAIAIDTPRTSRHGNLNIDQARVVDALGGGVETVRSAGTAVDDLGRSVARAHTESRPIMLMVPLDLVHQPVDDAQSVVPLATTAAPWPRPDTVAAAADLVVAAERPVVVAGRGAVRAGAGSALRVLAEQIGAVLAVSAPAKGLFADDPFDLSIAGSFASPLTGELLREADLILAFGASLNAWTTGNGVMLRLDIPTVQVDVEPANIGTHRRVDVGIHADAAATAEALTTELERRDVTKVGFRTDEVRQRLATRDPSQEFAPVDGGAGLDPRSFTLALNGIVPTERTVTVDSGHFMGWPAKYLDAPDAAGWVYPQGFQCVGLGLANAIGAAVARPDRISVLAIGDGGLMLSPREIDTAVRHRLPLLVVIYDDGAYGAEVHRFAPIGLEVDLVQFGQRDFAAIARAAGANALTITDLADLAELKPWLEDPTGPMVLDVRIDPSVVGDWVGRNSKAALA